MRWALRWAMLAAGRGAACDGLAGTRRGQVGLCQEEEQPRGGLGLGRGAHPLSSSGSRAAVSRAAPLHAWLQVAVTSRHPLPFSARLETPQFSHEPQPLSQGPVLNLPPPLRCLGAPHPATTPAQGPLGTPGMSPHPGMSWQRREVG